MAALGLAFALTFAFAFATTNLAAGLRGSLGGISPPGCPSRPKAASAPVSSPLAFSAASAVGDWSGTSCSVACSASSSDCSWPVVTAALAPRPRPRAAHLCCHHSWRLSPRFFFFGLVFGSKGDFSELSFDLPFFPSPLDLLCRGGLSKSSRPAGWGLWGGRRTNLGSVGKWAEIGPRGLTAGWRPRGFEGCALVPLAAAKEGLQLEAVRSDLGGRAGSGTRVSRSLSRLSRGDGLLRSRLLLRSPLLRDLFLSLLGLRPARLARGRLVALSVPVEAAPELGGAGGALTVGDSKPDLRCDAASPPSPALIPGWINNPPDWRGEML